MKERFIKRENLLPFILLVVCFALWGAANNMTDILLAAFKKVMSMTDTQTSLIQFAFYGAYFCLALPAAFIIRKYDYKTGVLVGLLIYAIGAAMCYPASKTMEFSHFLMAFYVFAGGCAILETAVAPYILVMGPAESATRRINFAQAFNPVGSLLGIFLGKEIILAGLDVAGSVERAAMTSDHLKMIQEKELSNVSTAYLIVGVLGVVLAVIMLLKKFPKSKADSFGSIGDSARRLFKNKRFVLSVIAQFFYVGVQICVWSFTIRYVMENSDIVSEEIASNYYLASIVVFSVSRFIFTALMRYITPTKLLHSMALIGTVLCIAVIFVGGWIGIYSVIGISICMSLMFPTIYGLGLEDVGDDRKLGGSFIIMAIVGGAVLTPVQAMISDASTINLSFTIPLICFLVIVYFANYMGKKYKKVLSR
ncbi:MAG: L-fucose:H+ symporter permease [Cyclobacteriaceae bacterium]|nr:L-fucose:H+ symporter permease [Cyclobacteriaceae bacterium]